MYNAYIEKLILSQFKITEFTSVFSVSWAFDDLVLKKHL